MPDHDRAGVRLRRLGDGHWQRWAAATLAACGAAVTFPELSDPATPQKDVWVAELYAILAAARRRGEPVTFLCHSLGCWAVDHLLAEHGADGVHAALLVAPPSPFLVFEPVDSFPASRLGAPRPGRRSRPARS